MGDDGGAGVVSQQTPYGVNITKRLVVPAAEHMLYTKLETNTKDHYVELVDYMGGDELVKRVATAGHGTDIFPEKPNDKQFMEYISHNGIHDPFKWVQFTFRIQASIADALHLVYEPRCSVNEYSGRYSEMIESSFLPDAEYLMKHMDNPNLEKATEAAALFLDNRETNYSRYQELVDEDGVALARELARTPLGMNNDTKFYWKMDLYSLMDFIGRKKARLGEDNTLSPLLYNLEELAGAVAPIAAATLIVKPNHPIDLTFPKDEDIVGIAPAPALWEPSETIRAISPELDALLYVPQELLDHGKIQAVEYMGHDRRIAEAARTSYGAGTIKKSQDTALIRYLYRHLHTSPFEMNELAFESVVPIFADPRQGGRHRTLDFTGFMGETVAGKKYFYPDVSELKKPEKINRQGRGVPLAPEEKDFVNDRLTPMNEDTVEMVDKLRVIGIDEQTMRNAKGVGFYNPVSRTGDTKNLLHYLGLRDDPHAQKEIRDQAKIVSKFVEAFNPSAFSAFKDYFHNGVRFSEQESIVLGLFSDFDNVEDALKEHNIYQQKNGLSLEGIEFIKKIDKIRGKND